MTIFKILSQVKSVNFIWLNEENFETCHYLVLFYYSRDWFLQIKTIQLDVLLNTLLYHSETGLKIGESLWRCLKIVYSVIKQFLYIIFIFLINSSVIGIYVIHRRK